MTRLTLADFEEIQEGIEEQLGDEVITTRFATTFPASRSDEEVLAEVESTYQEFYGSN